MNRFKQSHITSALLTACVALLSDTVPAHQSTVYSALAVLPPVEASQAVRMQRVSLELIHADSGQALPGNVRIRSLDSNTYWIPPEAVPRPNNWFSIPASARITLPLETLEIEAFLGLATKISRVMVGTDDTSTGDVQIVLHPLKDVDRRKWWSGNTHLHLAFTEKGPKVTDRASADRYLETAPDADGLDIVFLSYLARKPDDVNYISNAYTATDLARLSERGALFGNGQEHRHNFGAEPAHANNRRPRCRF